MSNSDTPAPDPDRQDKPDDKRVIPDDKRVIQVCSRWRDQESGLKNFMADMGHLPEGTSIA